MEKKLSKAAARKRRQELIAMHPRVRRLKHSVPCEGIKYKHVHLHHLYQIGNKPALGIPDKAKCTKEAHWQFTHLKRKNFPAPTRTQYFCWSHLIYSGIHNDMDESEATERFWKRLDKKGLLPPKEELWP